MANLCNSLLACPAIFGAMLIVGATALAGENPAAESPSVLETSSHNVGTDTSNAIEQVTSVSQLSDVQPTDWAFQALQSLVERYGCIAGYPDSTYRGNRALTRYEFAAGLNACLDRVNELIASATSDLVRKEDLATLQRLQEEFTKELATLRGRVDSLEANTAQLQATQFSTTTKLNGQIIFGVAGIATGQNAGKDIDRSPVLINRTRLELLSSFTGRDQLLTRLSTGNFVGFPSVTGTPEGQLSFAQDDKNNIRAEVVEYSFPLTEQTKVFVAATGGAFDDFSNTVNLLDGDGGSGALSAFGTRNPIYYLGNGAGLGIQQELGKNFELSLGYLAGQANNPFSGNGVLKGPYSAIAQLVFKPSDRFTLGLTYVNSYKADQTGTGSSRTSFSRFDDVFFQNLGIEAVNVPTSSNSYAVELSWHVSDRFVLGGWAGYTNTQLLSTAGGLFDRGSFNIWNYAVTLGFPDLGKQGNLLGFVVGMEPRVTSSSIISTNPGINTGRNRDTSLHVEGFYQYQVTDNIAITPGVIWITAPDFDKNNGDIVIGALRTTFSF